jgi:hypothetical protein
MISSITWLAAFKRSATFALSSSAARADREQAVIASPQNIVAIFFIIIVLPFASQSKFSGGAQ